MKKSVEKKAWSAFHSQVCQKPRRTLIYLRGFYCVVCICVYLTVCQIVYVIPQALEIRVS